NRKSMETLKKKARAVKFDKYGGIDVLHIDEVPVLVPEDDQVLVRVMAAGINPGEAAIRQGYMDKQWPAHFPSGQGSDFAGVIERVGDKVDKFKVGDEVIGFTDDRASQAEYVTVDANHIIRRPSHVSWEQAGALFVVGTTAYAAIRAVGLKKGETLVVSGAAGGVGSIVVQLARNLGARVIGLASKSNHEWITRHGGIPVTYGEVMTERIDTIIDFEAAHKHHVKTEGNAEGAKAGVLAELANLIDKGRLEIPIARIYNLNDVRDAYQELEKRHTHGKIVLVP